MSILLLKNKLYMEVEYKEIIWIISVSILIYGKILYINSILKWKTKPHSYSWLIWTILMAIGFIWQYSDNWWSGTWVLLTWVLTSFLTLILSLKYGTTNITQSDKWILYCILCGIIIYFYSQNLKFTILLVILLDALWYIPTIRKTRIAPYSEDLLVWSISILPLLWAIIALDNYTFLTYWYLTVLISMNSIVIAVIIYYRRYPLKI